MIFLFEQFQYSLEYLKNVLPKDEMYLAKLPSGFVTRDYKLDGVGYFYNGKEIIFVLPKVFLDAEGKKAFGKAVEPNEHFDLIDKAPKDFLAQLALWVCSSIGKYRLENPSDRGMDAPDARNFTSSSVCPTLIDVKNAMERFYQENRSLFVFVSKNVHSGNNRIDWRRTMRKLPFLQGESQIPIYMDLVNKKKVFDLDDRLIVLYFSAMNFIHETFGFKMPSSEFYEPMRVNEFRRLLGHRGLMELRRIKHKYFADSFLRLYNIMKAFFEWGANFTAGGMNCEYLLTSKYNNVFESMIDTLVSDPGAGIDRLKHNDDGKVIDHLYKEGSLIFSSGDSEKIWHIGDSKYYTDPADIRGESIAKQFTYAKNIIQDFFSPGFVSGSKNHDGDIHQGVRYRDELTEGYSVTPNFFIRGELPKFADSAEKQAAQFKDPYFRPTAGGEADDFIQEVKGEKVLDGDEGGKSVDVKDYLWNHRNRQFQNRLFDRDTLLLQVYNVNFLYVLKAYTAKGSGLRDEFRTAARAKFRENFLKLLDEHYAFWAVYPNENPEQPEKSLDIFVNKHFRLLAGKMFCPQGAKRCLILALEKGENSAGRPGDCDDKSLWKTIDPDCAMIVPLSPAEIWDSDKYCLRQSEYKKRLGSAEFQENDGKLYMALGQIRG